MSQLPFEQTGSLRIGTVDFVSPDDIKVILDIEAPESIALNTGAPRPFPRVNSYLLIPVDEGFLVGQVEWITVEQSPFPKRRGMQDFGLVDLPYPLRRLRLNPLGTLRAQSVDGQHVFQRGADALPSVGRRSCCRRRFYSGPSSNRASTGVSGLGRVLLRAMRRSVLIQTDYSDGILLAWQYWERQIVLRRRVGSLEP